MFRQIKNRREHSGILGALVVISCLFIPCTGTAESLNNSLFGTFKDYDNVLVIEVLTADTFRLEDREMIRLLGLKTPEVPKRLRIKEKRQEQQEKNPFLSTSPVRFPKKEIDPTVPLKEQAYLFTKDLLEGKRVQIELDIQSKDEDFYTLAYVFLDDGTFVNEEILRQGYATLKIMPPNTKYAQRLTKAYQEAHREKRGLHGE